MYSSRAKGLNKYEERGRVRRLKTNEREKMEDDWRNVSSNAFK
jgi:hypothetical protein